MNNIFLCLVLASVLTDKVHANEPFELNPPADWVISKAFQTDGIQTEGLSSSYLLFDQQLLFDKQQKHEYVRIVSQANNSKGLSELGKISVSFDPLYERLEFHHVNIIRDNQTIDVLQQDDFELIRQEKELESNIYNGKQTALLLIQDLQVNDIVEYDYTIIGGNPIFDNRIFAVFGLEWATPVKDLHISITIPRNKKVDIRTHKTTIKPRIEQQGELTHYAWHLSDIKPLDFQGNYPKWFEANDYLELTEFKNWQSVAQWAFDVFAIDTSLNNETTLMLDTWQTADTNNYDLATKALNFVQNDIRYMGIEIGVNSHEPRPPSEVFDTKYGDCKDKTMLLYAMLKHLNIKSVPALVSTELDKSIAARLPSPGLFNHVILNIQIDDNSFWVDPTVSNQGFALNKLGLPDFGYALLIDTKTETLTPIKRNLEQVNHIKTVEQLVVSNESQVADLAVKTIYHGDFAEYWRSGFKTNTVQSIQNQFESYTNQNYGVARSTKTLSFNDDLRQNKLTTDEAYLLDNPWDTHNEFEVIELFAQSLLAYVKMPARVNRDAPIALSFPIDLSHEFKITGDVQDLKIDDTPINISTQYLSYKRLTKQDDAGIYLEHQLTTLNDHIGVDELSDYYEIIKSIKKHLSVSLILPVNQKKRIKDSDDRLKSALQKMLKERQQ